MVCALIGVTLIATGTTTAQASPPSILGYATNFDVGNGTDKECEGFEVDIEDITDTQVTYTWPGSPGYPNPYGTNKTITSTTFADGHSGIKVKFLATYNGVQWSAKTPIGMVNHFGIHVNGTPGTQTYSWLCDLGGSAAGSTGTLTPYGGTTQGNYYVMPSVPSVVPAIVVTPTGEQVQPTIVPAVIPQPAEPRFPDAVWVLKYQASSANAVDVNQLLITDPEVQSAINNSQISSIAELFQPDPGTNQGAEVEPGDSIDPGDASSLTVTETYRYTGPVDPIDNSITCTETAGDPNNCSNFVGAMIARQMVSSNLVNTANRATLGVTIQTGVADSTAGGSVTSSATPTVNPGEIDCGATCFTSVDAGVSVVLTAAPNAGYHLQSWSGGGCTGSAATCTATVNGLTKVTATFYPDAATVYVADTSTPEGAAGKSHTANFRVVLTAPRPATTSVHYSTIDGSATAGADYTAKSGIVNIGANKTSAIIKITVLGDSAVEGEETLGVSVDSVSGSVAAGTSQATATILDDDTANAPLVSIGDVSVLEGNSGTSNAAFTVTMSAPSLTPTPISYETAARTAVAGSDYLSKTGTVTIPAGGVSAKISIVVRGDTVPEGNRTFSVNLLGTGSSGVAIDHDSGRGTILDDDTGPLVGIGIGDARVVEGDAGAKTVTMLVTMSSAQGSNTVVRYHTADGTAAADGDYTAKSGSITIAAGKTSGVITVVVNGDTSIEDDETFNVVLDSAASLALDRPTGTITIVGDD